MLRPPDADHETFLGQELSDPLTKVRQSSSHVEECADIVDFTGYLFLDLPLTRGRMEAEEVFTAENRLCLDEHPSVSRSLWHERSARLQ